MKLALYRHIRNGWVFAREVTENDIFGADYVRVSAIVDVYFPPLPPKEIDSAIATLEAKRATMAREHEKAIEGIERSKKALLGEAA